MIGYSYGKECNGTKLPPFIVSRIEFFIYFAKPDHS